MTVDERIEALVARHEALAQSVELLVSAQHETELRLQRLEAAQARTDEQMKRTDEYFRTLAEMWGDHEFRLRKLERREPETPPGEAA